MKERNIEDLAEAIKSAKEDGTSVCLFIGAGVSHSAGIADAKGFVDIIKNDYPQSFQRALKTCAKGCLPQYAACMAELTDAQRRSLVRNQINNAKINWAHVGIALLEEKEYVDRVLTVNFDPLVARACALLNRFPAIYDFTALQTDDGSGIKFIPTYVKDSAIYHLHGQHTGFALLNTDQKMQDQAKRLAPVLREAMQGRLVIVCGYSGNCDPLVKEISAEGQFQAGLYWFCMNGSNPADNVVDNLLDKHEDAFVIHGESADDFFISLARALDIFPPKFIDKPFDHMTDVLATLTPFSFRKDGDADLLTTTKIRIDQAKAHDETEFRHAADATDLMARERYPQVFEKYGKMVKEDPNAPNSLRDLVAWSYLMEGVRLSNEAEKCDGENADQLFDEAEQKFRAAIDIKTDDHETLYNWGNLLSERAERATGEDANRFFDEAEQKFRAAVDIRADDHNALNNWGLLLSKRAERATDEDANRLFGEAEDKYRAAINIKADDHDTLNNWGILLSKRAERATGEDANRLFDEAEAKYRAAIDIKPDKHQAYYNWGLLLSKRAERATGDEANRLFDEAEDKYRAAIDIKPDYHEAYNNWGLLLSERAQRAKGEDANRLFDEAEEKFRRVESLAPSQAEYDLACISALRGKKEKAKAHLQAAEKHKTMPDIKHLMEDHDLDSLREEAWFKKMINEMKHAKNQA